MIELHQKKVHPKSPVVQLNKEGDERVTAKPGKRYRRKETFTSFLRQLATRAGQLRYSVKKKPLQFIDLQRRITSNEKTMSCRGRIRTSTGQLAKAQSLVVNPGRPYQW